MIACDQKSNICMINMINRCNFFPGVSDGRKHLKEQCQLTGEQNKDVSSDADENRTRDFDEEEESQPSLSNNGFQLTMSVFFLRNDHQWLHCHIMWKNLSYLNPLSSCTYPSYRQDI